MATWTMQVQISISLGQPTLVQPTAPGPTPSPAAALAAAEAEKVPVIHPEVERREGYQPDFLGLSGDEVPLPELHRLRQENGNNAGCHSHMIHYYQCTFHNLQKAEDYVVLHITVQCYSHPCTRATMRKPSSRSHRVASHDE